MNIVFMIKRNLDYFEGTEIIYKEKARAYKLKCHVKVREIMIIPENILDEQVPKKMIPTRFDSVMNLYTNVSCNGKNGIIAYNISPDTWNCLYPFYELNHKFTIDEYKFDKENIAYRELIEEYQKVYKKIYEDEKGNTKNVRIQTLIDEYKKTFNLKDVNISAELLPIFELKYSKTKNVWTLYYFENYVANSVDNFDDLINQKLYKQEIMPLDSSIKELNGVDLTSNIPYLLSIESNIELLRDNLIMEEK